MRQLIPSDFVRKVTQNGIGPFPIDLVRTFNNYCDDFEYYELDPGQKGKIINYLLQMEDMYPIKTPEIAAFIIFSAIKNIKNNS